MSDHEMYEFQKRLDRHYATMQSILARLTALESRPCSPASSDSPAAAPAPTPPTPRRSAREVAEWVVDHAQDLYAKDGGTLLFSARQAIRQAALAAIERDREGR